MCFRRAVNDWFIICSANGKAGWNAPAGLTAEFEDAYPSRPTAVDRGDSRRQSQDHDRTQLKVSPARARAGALSAGRCDGFGWFRRSRRVIIAVVRIFKGHVNSDHLQSSRPSLGWTHLRPGLGQGNGGRAGFAAHIFLTPLTIGSSFAVQMEKPAGMSQPA